MNVYVAMELPGWSDSVVVGGVIAALGYVGRQTFDALVAMRRARGERRARLVTLLSLLRGSRAVFVAQAHLRDRLLASLAKRPGGIHEAAGYDQRFHAAYPELSPAERELHGLVRGYTIHGTQPLNEAMLAWLAADSYFKEGRSVSKLRRELAVQLAALEAHLLLWRAKYQVWIPETPSRALVYLGDEEGHGVPFPTGIESTIARVLRLPEKSDP